MAVDPRMTRKDYQFLRKIHELTCRQGSAPTLQEVGAAMGTSSTQTVSWRVRRLEAAGLLARSAGKARSLRVLHPEAIPPAEPDPEALEEIARQYIAWMERPNGHLQALLTSRRVPAGTLEEALAWARDPSHPTRLDSVRLYRLARRALGLG